MRDRVVAGELTTSHVITSEEFDYLRAQPERASRWREYVAGGANLYCFDGSVPCNVFVFADTVLVGNAQSTPGQESALIECDDEAALTWADRLVDRYRRQATLLEATAFDAEPDVSEG